MSRSGMHVCFQNQLLPPSCRPSFWRSSAYWLPREVERTLKSGNQFATQREILLPSLFNQIMQCFPSIAHIKQVASGNLDVYILVRFCVVRLMVSPLTLTTASDIGSRVISEMIERFPQNNCFGGRPIPQVLHGRPLV